MSIRFLRNPWLNEFYSNIFSFEAAFVLFLFSFQYKHIHPLLLEFDITFLFALILIPATLYLFKKQNIKGAFDNSLLTFLIFTSWCLISAFWSPSYKYMLSKSLCFAVYTAPAFLMARSIIAKDPLRLRRLIVLITSFTIFIHFAAYRALIKSNMQMSEVLGNNYLVTGQTVGVGLLIMVAFSLFRVSKIQDKKQNFYKDVPYILSLLLCGSFAYLLFHLGGRGPLISAFLSFTLTYAYGLFCSDKKIIFAQHGIHLLIVGSLAYFTISWALAAETNPFIARMNALTTLQEPDASLSLRFQYYASAVHAFLAHPLIGVGFGGWPLFHELGDIEWHPHNIFLEVACETGLIGLIFFCGFLLCCLRKINRVFMSHMFPFTILGLLVFSFFNALKSGDLNDNILLFMSLGLISGLPHLSKTNRNITYLRHKS